jgi:hypothetical protein
MMVWQTKGAQNGKLGYPTAVSSSAADIGSPLSVRCINHLREVHNRQGFASPRRKMHELWEGRRDGSQRSLAGDGMATNQILGTGSRRVKTSAIPTSRKF